MLFRRSFVGVLAWLAAAPPASAHGPTPPSGGRPGDPAKVTRIVEVVATENAFSLKALDVRDGETMAGVPHDGETLGEVMMRGNVVMKGYLKNRKSTGEAFAGGWFHTGDIGVMHADGYIQLKDRSKDIIISGGENISSIEVEDALYKHPAVMAVAVVAKPDDKWGETPCAFVELKVGMSATPEELTQWCRKHLAGYKVPRHVVFAEIPKTSTGKIQKFKLREMAKAV